MSSRVGKIQDYNKFDVSFFDMVDQLAEMLDPQAKLLIETTYEAIIDAGQFAYLI